MSDEQQAAEEPETEEAEAEAEEQSLEEGKEAELSEEEARLQKQLEKQIEKFRACWLRMDSDYENERENSFRSVQKVMARINEIHEELTGEKGSLNFADLLEKIETGGGGASSEEIEQMQLVLQQYEEVNEALAMAEDMLRREVRMLRFLMETKGYEKVSFENPQELTTKFLDNIENIQAVCDSIHKFFDVPEGKIENAYTTRLSHLFNTRYDDMQNGLSGFSRSLASWLMKRQGLPGTIEDLMEVQCIARGHETILNEERALVEKLQSLEDVSTGLEEALKCLMHQTYSDQHMKEMLENLEFMEQRLIQMEELEETVKERENDIAALKEQLSEAREETGRQRQSIKILNETIDALKATQRINAPLHDPELENLDLSKPEDLRKSVEILMTVAREGPTESRMNKDDLRRENALLREKVALLQNGKESDRYDIVDRQTLAKLVQSNEELENALEGYRRKLENILGSASNWEEKHKTDIAALKEEFEAKAVKAQEAHETAKDTAVKEAVEEKNRELAVLREENGKLKLQVTRFDKERVKFRRDISKQVNDGILWRSAIIGAAGFGAGAGSIAYVDYMQEREPTAIVQPVAQPQQETIAPAAETTGQATIAPAPRP
jgi:kynurenine formamidase